MDKDIEKINKLRRWVYGGVLLFFITLFAITFLFFSNYPSESRVDVMEKYLSTTKVSREKAEESLDIILESEDTVSVSDLEEFQREIERFKADAKTKTPELLGLAKYYLDLTDSMDKYASSMLEYRQGNNENEDLLSQARYDLEPYLLQFGREHEFIEQIYKKIAN